MTKSPQEQLTERGFVLESFDAGGVDSVRDLLADKPIFDEAVADSNRRRLNRVPYILTDAIAEMAHQSDIVRAVENALGTDSWVMWGPNIRTGTPNDAHRWHVDLESFLWPSLTVAIGLQGCAPEAATWFIPASHRLARAPSASRNDCDTDEVVRKASSLDDRCGEPEQITGFGDGRCYLFNARCWHRGDPTTSTDRVVLFLHYQRADERRIPYMLDYERNRWSRDPAPYIVSPACRHVEAAVYRPPLSQVVGGFLHRVRRSVS